MWTEVEVVQVEDIWPQLENQPADTELSREQQRILELQDNILLHFSDLTGLESQREGL